MLSSIAWSIRAAALAGEDRQQRDERQHEQERQRLVLRRERGEQADRREQDVDEEDEPGHAQLQARRHAEHEPLADRAGGGVADELAASASR